MSNGDVPLMRFDFARGALRGSSLMLYPASLVHRGAQYLETISLATVAAVRVEFARDTRKINWGVALVVVALILFVLSAPLASLAGAAADDVATAQGGSASGESGAAGVVQATFRGLGAAARMLPLAGTIFVALAIALVALGWLGQTTLTVNLGAVERAYPVLGRNLMMFDFAEAVGERLRAFKR
jgi:hypothetical protein